MLTINTRAPLLGAGNDLNRNQGPLETALKRLASGKRVNRAADDPAALAIATRLAEQLLGGEQSMRNLNDGVSLVQTAEGGLSEIGDAVQRIRELSVQSGNGTLSDADRSALQAEVGELQEQVTQAIGNTSFNGINPLRQDGSLQFQAGSDAGDTISVNSRDLQSGLANLGFFAIDISSASGASAALDTLDRTSDLLSGLRGELGASQNRFEAAVRNLDQQYENTAAAQSRILDTDYARSTAELSHHMILQNAGLAMFGQANASAGLVGQLLGRG